MNKNLVIVESPAKAKTIEKFLGEDYKVQSSYGHIRDLKKKNFSIDTNTFAPQYEIPADKQKIVQTLKKMSAESETVWLASDEDREGEAISWHLQQVLELDPTRTKRIVFHEITQNAILEAIEHPRQIDENLVNAQQARRLLDRIVGFKLSPVLWRKVKPALSAGRVQSVAVRLIVEKEREVLSFKSETAYRVTGIFLTENGEEVRAELPRRFMTQEEAQAFLESCKGATFTIQEITKKPAKRSPAPPFTTSTLQQEAARKLGFSVSQTMVVAQHLYENGQITYMAGKQELIHIGAFDDVDMAMMIHSHAATPGLEVFINGSSLGYEAKEIVFEGKTFNTDAAAARYYGMKPKTFSNRKHRGWTIEENLKIKTKKYLKKK